MQSFKYKTKSLSSFLLGCTSKRRTDKVSRLNALYANILPIRRSIQKCLKYLCQTDPYRMLKDWTYEMATDPIQSGGEENNTDVSFFIIKIDMF